MRRIFENVSLSSDDEEDTAGWNRDVHFRAFDSSKMLAQNDLIIDESVDVDSEEILENEPVAAESSLDVAQIREEIKEEALKSKPLEAGVPVEKTRGQIARHREQERQSSAGAGWFHMKGPTDSEEIEQDHELIQMRAEWAPEVHYRNNDRAKMHPHAQHGRIVAGAADFYSGRLTKSERKRTVVEELLQDAKLRERVQKEAQKSKKLKTRGVRKVPKSKSKRRARANNGN